MMCSNDVLNPKFGWECVGAAVGSALIPMVG